MVVGYNNGDLQQWDITTGILLKRISTKHRAVRHIAHSPDGSTLVSAGADSEVIFWNTTTWQADTEPLISHKGSILSIDYSPDNHYVVSGDSSGKIQIWNAVERHPYKAFKNNDAQVTSVSYSDNSRYIALGGEAGNVTLLDTKTRQFYEQSLISTENSYLSENHYASNVAHSPNGDYIVSVNNRALNLWYTTTIKKSGEALIIGENGVFITSLDYSSNGKHLVTGNTGGKLQLWNTETRQANSEAWTGHKSYVTSVAFSPNDHYIASGGEDGSVRLWSTATMEEYSILPQDKHGSRVVSLAFSPDGRHIISGHIDGKIIFWNTFTGKTYNSSDIHKGISNLTYSPDGEYIASSGFDGTVRIWANDGQMQRVLEHKHPVMNVAYSPDGGILATSNTNGVIHMWDTTSWNSKKIYEGAYQSIRHLAYSPDGNLIAAGWNVLSLFDFNGQLLRSKAVAFGNAITDVKFSPNGRYVALGIFDRVQFFDTKTVHSYNNALHVKSSDGTARTRVIHSSNGLYMASTHMNLVRLWNTKTGENYKTLKGHKHNVTDIAYSSDGRYLVSGSVDKTIRLWDTKSGETLSMLKEHTGRIDRVEYSPYDHQIISISGQNLIAWDTLTKNTHKLSGITSAIYSPDGLHVANINNTIRLLDTKTFQEIGSALKGYKTPAKIMTYSDGDHYLSSVSSDSTVRLWDMKNYQEKFSIDVSNCMRSPTAVSIFGSRVFIGSKSGIAILNLDDLGQIEKCLPVPASTLTVADDKIIAEHKGSLTFLSPQLEILGKGLLSNDYLLLESEGHFSHSDDLPFAVIGFKNSEKQQQSWLYDRYDSELVFKKITNQYSWWDELVEIIKYAYLQISYWYEQANYWALGAAGIVSLWLLIFVTLTFVYLIRPGKLTQWTMLKSDDVAFPIKITKFLTALNWFGHRERALKGWLKSNKNHFNSMLFLDTPSVVERNCFAKLGDMNAEYLLSQTQLKSREPVQYWFTGPGGAGKSALAFQLTKTLVAKRRHVVPILITRDWEGNLEDNLCREDLNIKQRMLTAKMLNKLLSRGYLLLIFDALSEKTESHLLDVSRLLRESKAPLLMVTSRTDKPDSGEWTNVVSVQPDQITTDTVENFIRSYDDHLSDQDIQNATQAITAQLSNSGNETLNPLFGRLIVDAIAGKDSIDQHPVALVLSYVKRLHNPLTFASADEVIAAAKFVAFLLVANTESFRPGSMTRTALTASFLDHNRAFLGHDNSDLMGSQVIDSLIQCGLLIRMREKVKFQYDPLAEYFAIYYALDTIENDAGGAKLLRKVGHHMNAEKYQNLVRIRDEIIEYENHH